MPPEMGREPARQGMEALRRGGGVGRVERVPRTVRLAREVVLRGARHGDHHALAALAALDGTLPPVGPALVAEVEGTIAAVLPLDGGPPFSDPFRQTGDLLALLEERARQIHHARTASQRRGRLASLLPALHRKAA